MTSPRPRPDPSTTPSGPGPGPTPARPSDAADGALFDAIATEHATIYGYGVVSAHSVPEVNYLVSEAMAEHRNRREAAITLLEERGVAVPLPAAGYSLPMEVDTPAEAANLAVTMEQDGATAWRAVVEQATDQTVRAFGVTALTESAVTAARWRRVRGDAAITVAFPGGTE
ncbi:MAG: ferritin-like domain-containing protein [Mycobacterium sp.]|nr:ferritin-like domain-containing protein [Mycobacterium sp.]